MTLTVRLPDKEENILESTAQRLGRTKSDLVRQAVHELCQKFAQDEHSAYAIGQDLFDAGELSVAPDDSLKQQIWNKLRDKHAIQMSDK